MTKETGGPAFPTPVHNIMNDGMTLRDYFAAHRQAPEELTRAWGEAMVGPFPKKEGSCVDAEFGPAVVQWWADVEARWSYVQADAMLEAREQ